MLSSELQKNRGSIPIRSKETYLFSKASRTILNLKHFSIYQVNLKLSLYKPREVLKFPARPGSQNLVVIVLFCRYLCCTVVICVVLLLLMLFYVLLVCKCVLYHCHRVFTQLQLTNTSLSVSRQQAHEGGKVVSPKHPSPIHLVTIPGTYLS